jgi:DNA-binding transcriptional MerR regulator
MTEFDLVRISSAKKACGVCSNTIRAYAREGLALYKKGRATFFSRAELADHIRRTATKQPA